MPAKNLYQIKNQILFVRDAPSDFYDSNSKNSKRELAYHFRDALAIFRTRVELLGNLEHQTTKNEEESMTLMLETLFEGKRQLSGKRNDIIK